jgi:hypothetical protein
MKNPSMKRLYVLAGDFLTNKYTDRQRARNCFRTKEQLDFLNEFILFVFDKQSEAQWRKNKEKN